MGYSIWQGFEYLRSNLEITDLQASTTSTRQKNVRASIANGMSVIDDFLTGSYARSTMLSPLKEADLDVFIVLDPKYYHYYNGQNGGPAALLDFTKRTLLKTYTTTPDVSRNGQAVTIRFTDFSVDVVVGFNRTGGGYIMANSINNQWLETDPKKHVEISAAANARHKGLFVPTIKMIKSWNRANGGFFRSFHLEVLALAAFQGVTISDYPSGMRYFFDKARVLVKGQNLDPAGYGDDIGRYITAGTVDGASKRFENAFNAAVNAEMRANHGDIPGALDIWRKLMPNHFPG
jgi:hypothetical protein